MLEFCRTVRLFFVRIGEVLFCRTFGSTKDKNKTFSFLFSTISFPLFSSPNRSLVEPPTADLKAGRKESRES